MRKSYEEAESMEEREKEIALDTTHSTLKTQRETGRERRGMCACLCFSARVSM